MTLDIKSVSKYYKNKKALDNVNIKLSSGIYGLLGPNGAGKSTLMNIISGNVSLKTGEVLFDNEDIKKLGKNFKNKLGFMPQQQTLYDEFTAKQFLYYITALKGMPKKQAKKEIAEYAELVDLTSELDKKLGVFSGGMKQRVLIAQAILNNPSVLILDEPTAGLDPKERIRIRNLISKVALNKIVIFATHVVSDIEFIAKKIILLKDGKVISKQTPQDFISNMNDLVFEVNCKEKDIPDLESSFKISNISKNTNGVCVKLISEKIPTGYQYTKVLPTLEEVYLYHFDDIKA